MESYINEIRGSSGKTLLEVSLILLTFTIVVLSPEYSDGRSPSVYDFSILF